MSCSPFDLRDYVLGELANAERRQMDVHLRSCGICQEEVERLRVTQSALLALRDEEVPQRIGFVSDPVFEPSAARRVWRAFWGSGPRLAFAGAAMLSAALMVSAVLRPSPPAAVAVPASMDTAKIEQRVSERVAIEVRKAVAESEAREEKKTAELLAAAEQRFEQHRKADLKTVGAGFLYLQKKFNVVEHASYETGGSR